MTGSGSVFAFLARALHRTGGHWKRSLPVENSRGDGDGLRLKSDAKGSVLSHSF
jgi:hypothetical protein